ncbi:MAG: hypothetical protein PHF86_10280 [Candidatus Nanoarchaeia archaeon]|nr:hypothetical protein [Candidatus Nanoarchaeia archaeon]
MNRTKAYELADELTPGMDGGRNVFVNELAKDIMNNTWLKPLEDLLECRCTFTIKGQCKSIEFDFQEIILKSQKDKLIKSFSDKLDLILASMYTPD